VKRFFADMNPTIRGFLIIVAICVAVVVLQLQASVISLLLLVRIAFFLAIAFFIYLVWREHRGDIATWPARARTVFYGSALLIVVDFGVWFARGVSGRDALAFFLVLGLCGYAMFRVWKDQRTYV
jgi:small-conductance mechanosensitive channel